MATEKYIYIYIYNTVSNRWRGDVRTGSVDTNLTDQLTF